MNSAVLTYAICWFLIILLVVALSLVIIYSRKIENCRTSKVLYCYVGKDNGWRCNSPDGVVTLHDQLIQISQACNPIDCPTLGDTTPDVPGTTQFTILPLNSDFSCGIATGGYACNPQTDETSNTLLNFPGDPLIPANGTSITGPDIMNWFCNINKPATTSKVAALNEFTSVHSNAYACNTIDFK